MRIFVTGASGFLGAEVCRQLAAKNHAVIANGRDLPRLREVAAAAESAPGDLLTMNLETWLKDVDAVVHSAALSSPWGTARAFEEANIEATRRLVAAAKAVGVRRFVHISTPAIYYDETDRLGLTESSPFAERSANHYVRTKLASERLVLREIPSIVLRPRAIFGPGDRTLFPRLAAAAKKRRLRIFGNGENICDLTYVDNAARAIVCAIHAPEACAGNAYNVTNGEPVNLWQCINRLLEKCGLQPVRKHLPKSIVLALASCVETAGRFTGGNEPWITRYTAGLLMYSQTFDISRARHELGYEPEVSVEEGICRFAEWFRRV